MNTLEEKNKEYLNKIKKKKFSKRFNQSFDNFQVHYTENQQITRNKLAELKEKPLKQYQNWYVSYYSNNQKNELKKKSLDKIKKSSILENINQLEYERKLKDMETIKKIEDFGKSHLKRLEDSKNKFERINHEYNNKLKKVVKNKKNKHYRQKIRELWKNPRKAS